MCLRRVRLRGSRVVGCLARAWHLFALLLPQQVSRRRHRVAKRCKNDERRSESVVLSSRFYDVNVGYFRLLESQTLLRVRQRHLLLDLTRFSHLKLKSGIGSGKESISKKKKKKEEDMVMNGFRQYVQHLMLIFSWASSQPSCFQHCPQPSRHPNALLRPPALSQAMVKVLHKSTT